MPSAATGTEEDGELDPQMAARLAAVGSWALEVRPLRFRSSSAWNRLHDFPQDARVRLTTALRMISAAHRRRLFREIAGCARDGGALDLVVPTSTPGDRSLFMRIIGERVLLECGRILVRGACQDVSGQVARQNQMEAVVRRLTETLESVTDGFMNCDRDWRVTYLNAAAQRSLRLPRDQVLNSRLFEVFPPLLASEFEGHCRQAWTTMRPCVFTAFHEPLGAWMEFRGFPSEQGFSIWFRDATRERALQQELQADRQRLEQLADERARQLQSLSAELTSFTTSVAHDVRAPLAAIQGFSHALERRLPQADDKARHYLRRITDAIGRTQELVDGLLQLARIGHVEICPEHIDVSDLALAVVDALRAQSRQRRVEVQIQPGMQARADRKLLRTALENLIGNAWKFTGRKDVPAISVGQDAGGVFFVRDNGAGFDPRRAADLFAPFKRLHAEEEFPGVGVGLASVRRVLERHGGRVWAESTPGQGAVFHFTLGTAPAE